MIYILAILIPPLAVLLKGKPIQALINLALCCLLWIPAVFHAFAVINKSESVKRHKKEMKKLDAIEKSMKNEN
jgi:uncharacterized membrane protein YqaE (UPF0057 family)